MKAIFVGTLDGVFKVTRTSVGGWQAQSKRLLLTSVITAK